MNSKIKRLLRKNIFELSPYSSAREEYVGKEGIFLDANENPYGIYNRYPDPYQNQLKQKLAEIKKCKSNQIFIGNGSDEVIDLAFRIFCEPYQDTALTFAPTYGMYQVSADINAVELIQIPLNKNFQIDRKTVENCLKDENLKLIFICSPNNPTGNLLNTDDIEFILQKFSGIVIIDEAYIDFAAQNSFIEKLNIYPNLIVSQTLSKAWGLAGIRLGVAYMNEEILAFYNKVKSPYNISSINQEMTLKYLNQQEEFNSKLNEILFERTKLINELNHLNLVKKVYPTDANFILMEVKNADELYKKLIEKQIIIRNRNSVIPKCLRITVGTPEENQKLITELKVIDNG
ncbi:histidinol-phosphate aminotransferase [Moheibacter sediminis]|uniref:Histidinol-phosphate aminotransferase n=2 Tax=Moheibacter sediminis TaxID=1434700 RepID=A0A1W1ZBU1_9FLAO|nr:histidinol-phosphate aminotransferase [Moheibacter sediminis]